MINIINNILLSNGYNKIESEFILDDSLIYIFCPKIENKREEYFVTIQLYNQSEDAALNLLENKVDELFTAISYSGLVNQTFQKNSTLLLCYEENKISRNMILSIEEDQYNFKKNVVTYSNEELVSLDSYLKKKQVSNITNDVINKIINAEGGSEFLNFKINNQHQKDHYSLILKTTLKLPFITYSQEIQELSSLLDDIDSSLSSEQSLLFNKLISSGVEWTEANATENVLSIWSN
jgi:hypothetical protein